MSATALILFTVVTHVLAGVGVTAHIMLLEKALSFPHIRNLALAGAALLGFGVLGLIASAPYLPVHLDIASGTGLFITVLLTGLLVLCPLQLRGLSRLQAQVEARRAGDTGSARSARGAHAHGVHGVHGTSNRVALR